MDFDCFDERNNKYEIGLEERIKKLESILREMTDVYKELVDDAGGCDHSVGICWCDDYWLIERAEKALENV